MFWFLKKKETDTDKEILERYKTDFGILRERRFSNHDESTFCTKIHRHSLVLELWKSNHFAWIPSDLYQYRDFYLETALSFGRCNGHSAAGLIFRYLNDENFYYFLVSNRGMFRFDVLFNGNPLRIIEWSPSKHIQSERCNLRVIAHGSYFSFFIEDEWVAEIEDEKLLCGKMGIAAQNFNEEEKASFVFHNLLVDSRPVQVEKAHWRWVRYIPVEAESRISFARTLVNAGNHTAAAVQLTKALKFDDKNEDALLLLALCETNLKLYDQALQTLEKLLALNPKSREAVFEKANNLYLKNDYLAARDYLATVLESYGDSSTLWNLYGNCEYSLGNWEKACDAYRKAAELEPDMPLFFANFARMLEKCDKSAEALKAYVTAAHLFFRQDGFDDLSLILPRIRQLEPDNPDVLGFEAKMLFHENRKAEAKAILEKLVAGTHDSAIPYLYALTLIDEGKREDALPQLVKATRLDSGEALYWWRLAESKRFLKKEYRDELDKASLLAPGDPWVLNLYGLYYFDQGETGKAFEQLEKAHKAAPEEIEITINLSEALFRLGKKKEARSLIERGLRQHDDPRLYNHQGNLLSRDGDLPRAVEAYERAMRLDPGNPLYMENCAASCLEAEMITRAEDLLVRLSEKNPTASVLNLLGNLAMLRMEYLRAELCYAEALRLDPADTGIRINFASLLLERSQYARAKTVIGDLVQQDPNNPRVIALQEKMRKRFEISIACSQCGRQWWVNRDIPVQETGKIHDEPPRESPAGKCPSCGRVFCIACGETHMKEKRFVCPECGEFLKLSDNYLKYLVLEHIEEQKKTEQN